MDQRQDLISCRRGAWGVGRGAWGVGRGAWGVGRGGVGPSRPGVASRGSIPRKRGKAGRFTYVGKPSRLAPGDILREFLLFF
jgi:hypothetical protein